MTNSEGNPHYEYVVCVDNDGYEASLEKHKIYRALRDQSAAQDEDLRVVDESGEDYRYPSARFVPIAVPEEVERSLSAAVSGKAVAKETDSLHPIRITLNGAKS